MFEESQERDAIRNLEAQESVPSLPLTKPDILAVRELSALHELSIIQSKIGEISRLLDLEGQLLDEVLKSRACSSSDDHITKIWTAIEEVHVITNEIVTECFR